METLTRLARTIFTLVLLSVLAWWLWEVKGRLGVVPVKDSQGNVLNDSFANAKDILFTGVIPLVTVTLGYWFGAHGREQAEGRADNAQAGERQAQQQLMNTEARLTAVRAAHPIEVAEIEANFK